MTVFDLDKNLRENIDQKIMSFERTTEIDPDKSFYMYTFVVDSKYAYYYDSMIDKYDGITISVNKNIIGGVRYFVYNTRFYLERFDGSGLGYLTAQEINEGKLK